MGSDSPVKSGTFSGWDDFVDPFGIAHSGKDPNNSFAGRLALPGAATNYNKLNPPTLGNANTIALQGTVDREAQMRKASTILTGGAGLLDDEQPRTASRTLLGY